MSATAISATSIVLKWRQPALFNGILYDYKIRYKLALDANYSSPISVGRQLNYTIIGLRPYSGYELKVKLLVILQNCVSLSDSKFHDPKMSVV